MTATTTATPVRTDGLHHVLPQDGLAGKTPRVTEGARGPVGEIDDLRIARTDRLVREVDRRHGHGKCAAARRHRVPVLAIGC